MLCVVLMKRSANILINIEFLNFTTSDRGVTKVKGVIKAALCYGFLVVLFKGWFRDFFQETGTLSVILMCTRHLNSRFQCLKLVALGNKMEKGEMLSHTWRTDDLSVPDLFLHDT